ncbi:MAG: DUF6364 family protein [Desulfobulbaceae bacterium]
MRKARLNLYVNRDVLDFAKKWSYVTGRPISAMLEEYLQEQEQQVRGVSPFQWLTDPVNTPSGPADESGRSELDVYLSNREEAEFCRQNPDHPRARLRAHLLEEYEKNHGEEMERRKKRERAFISRWMEVFPIK